MSWSLPTVFSLWLVCMIGNFRMENWWRLGLPTQWTFTKPHPSRITIPLSSRGPTADNGLLIDWQLRSCELGVFFQAGGSSERIVHETVKDAFSVDWGSQKVVFERRWNTELGLRYNRCDSVIDNECVEFYGITEKRGPAKYTGIGLNISLENH